MQNKKHKEKRDLSTISDDEIISLEKELHREKKKRNKKGCGIYILIVFIVSILLYFSLNYFDFSKDNKFSKDGDLDINSIHKKMYDYVDNDDSSLNILSGNPIRKHQDYQYFFDFLRKKNSKNFKSNKPIGKNVLSKIDNNTFSRFIYLDDSKDIKVKNNSLTITGAYTSSYHKPVGLFSVSGDIINPAIKDWGGAVVIKNGILNVENLKNISVDFRSLNIIDNFYDYKVFLKWIRENNVSVLQSHLIVDNSEIVVEERNKRFRRRVIFEDINSDTYIYDSFNLKLTLFETASVLREEYSAYRAINLDMGTYDYCRIRSSGSTKNCGYLKNTSILSNLIEITW